VRGLPYTFHAISGSSRQKGLYTHKSCCRRRVLDPILVLLVAGGIYMVVVGGGGGSGFVLVSRNQLVSALVREIKSSSD